MRRIIKRFVKKDQYGRVLVSSAERLVDDGNGRLHLATHTTTVACPGCGRPISDIADLRGCCQYCLRNTCCVHCESYCQACSRRICTYCCRGFAAQTPLTVCPACHLRLTTRQAYQDHLLAEKAAFDRQIMLQREWIRLFQHAGMKHVPGGRALSTLGQIGVMRKLKKLQRSLESRSNHAGRYLR